MLSNIIKAIVVVISSVWSLLDDSVVDVTINFVIVFLHHMGGKPVTWSHDAL